MTARYVRVSSTTQSIARQEAKENLGEKLFIDVISGVVPFREREGGSALIKAIEAKEIDAVVTSSIDRLGRNAFDCQSTIEFFNKHGVTLRIDNLGIESFVNGKPNPIFKLITDVLANIGQIERDAIRERQEEGIRIAKANKVYKGRAKGTTISDEELLKKYKEAVKMIKKHPSLSLRVLGKMCDVAPNTVKKLKEIIGKK